MTASSSHTSRARSWTGKRGPRKFEARWLDSAGVVRAAKGSRATGRFVPFETKTAAAAYAAEQADQVAKTLNGERGDERPATVDELLDLFLADHGPVVDPATERTLRQQLKHARSAFGRRDPETLRRDEIKQWRRGLSPGMQHYAFRAFRQALTWACVSDRGYLDRNPTDEITNPKRKRHERTPVQTFEWAEIEAVAAELSPVHAALVIVMGATGLRPEEAFGLHRSDVDWYAGPFTPGDELDRGRIHVQRRWTRGTPKEGTKTGGDRWVPFGELVERALKSLPPRIDTKILFPTPNGKHIDTDAFRNRHWLPALGLAGIGHHRLYDLRHTAITVMLKMIPHPQVAHIVGTSLAQLDATYSHYMPSGEQYGSAIDAYIGKAVGE